MATLTDSPVDLDGFNQGMRSDPLGTLTRIRAEGTVCVIPYDEGEGEGEQRILITTEPALANAALVHGLRTHRALLRELVGSGLFVVATGDQWRRRRALLRPMFTPRAVASGHGVILRAAEDFVRRELKGRDGRPMDLAVTMQRLSVQVILRSVDPALDGAELEELTEALQDAVEYLDHRLFVPDSVGEAEHEAFLKRRSALEAFIAGRAGQFGCPASEPGVLAEIVAALGEEAAAGEDPHQVLREELLSVFVAGVETMGTLLTWIFHNLAHNPEALRRSLAEVRAEDLDALAAQPSAPNGVLPYLRAVVEESLRLTPPAWALVRTIEEPLEAAGIELVPGDVVLAATYVMHHDPELWEAPEEFRPERFLGDRPPAQQYLPFGAGPHQCLGRQFSLLEAQLVAATVLRHGLVELLDPEPVTALRPHIALAPEPNPQAVFTEYGQEQNR
ncbi:cytochrome P450 [Kitasatospora sp. NPDC004289]